MSLKKRIKSLSFESLHELIDQAHQEIDRRQRVIQTLPPLRLQDIALSVRARDLLYRTIADKKKLAYWQDAQRLTLAETLGLLTTKDWTQINYKNAKAFDEIEGLFQAHKAPLEWYYSEMGN